MNIVKMTRFAFLSYYLHITHMKIESNTINLQCIYIFVHFFDLSIFFIIFVYLINYRNYILFIFIYLAMIHIRLFNS